MVQIIPAILATTEEEYKEKIDKISSNPAFEGGWVQIDIMDNKFVQNQSVGPNVMAKYPTELKLDAHLMVNYPEDWIDELIKANVSRIVFPIEDLSGTDERITHIKNHQIEVGLSLNPDTPIETVEPFVDKIDLILVMSVQPGFGGQEFIPSSVDKVASIKQKGWPVKIEVDGGITADISKQLVDAGADYLVIGSHLIEGDIDENIEEIWEKINDFA